MGDVLTFRDNYLCGIVSIYSAGILSTVPKCFSCLFAKNKIGQNKLGWVGDIQTFRAITYVGLSQSVLQVF